VTALEQRDEIVVGRGNAASLGAVGDQLEGSNDVVRELRRAVGSARHRRAAADFFQDGLDLGSGQAFAFGAAPHVRLTPFSERDIKSEREPEGR
jgi:hypothetical protein